MCCHCSPLLYLFSSVCCGALLRIPCWSVVFHFKLWVWLTPEPSFAVLKKGCSSSGYEIPPEDPWNTQAFSLGCSEGCLRFPGLGIFVILQVGDGTGWFIFADLKSLLWENSPYKTLPIPTECKVCFFYCFLGFFFLFKRHVCGQLKFPENTSRKLVLLIK